MNFLGNLFGKNKKPDLEDEFYDLFQTQVFEMMGNGVSPSEVAELATNKAAEIMMAKYSIPMPSMVKIIERSLSRHR